MVAIVWRWSYKRLGGALQMAIACAAVAKRELLRGNWCPRGQPQCKLGTPSCTGGCIRLLLVDRCAWLALSLCTFELLFLSWLRNYCILVVAVP